MTENTAPVERHDRRCERRPIDGATMTKRCNCAERAATGALMVEVGNTSVISNETQARATLYVGDTIEKMLHRMTRELVERVRAEERAPVLSTLHLVGEHNGMMDADELKLACLTVPEGVSPVSRFVLEVADDWMRARGLRR